MFFQSRLNFPFLLCQSFENRAEKILATSRKTAQLAKSCWKFEGPQKSPGWRARFQKRTFWVSQRVSVAKQQFQFQSILQQVFSDTAGWIRWYHEITWMGQAWLDNHGPCKCSNHFTNHITVLCPTQQIANGPGSLNRWCPVAGNADITAAFKFQSWTTARL